VTWTQAVILSPPWARSAGRSSRRSATTTGCGRTWWGGPGVGRDVHGRAGCVLARGSGTTTATAGFGGRRGHFVGRGQGLQRQRIPIRARSRPGAAADQKCNGVPDECETCYADCDKSGGLDIDDFLCFQTEYGSGMPARIAMGAGSWILMTSFCFQTAYAAGCP
jgi:hypothetical protein